MATKNITLKKEISGVLYDLMVKTSAEQVTGSYNSSEMTLDQIITALETAVNEKADGEAFATLKTQFENLTGGANEAYDTLVEIGNWITSHQDLYDNLVGLANGKVDKVEGKGLSTEDFTSELKAKLDALPDNTTLTQQLNQIEQNVTNIQNTVAESSRVLLSATEPEDLTEKDLWLEDTTPAEEPVEP